MRSFARAGTTGVSTGDETKKGIEVWARGSGNYTKQSERGGIVGYKATMWGTSLGADTETPFDKIRLGLGGGYALTDVESRNKNNKTDIESLQGSVYGTYDAYPFYLDAAVSFAVNDYRSERKLKVGTSERTAKSDYNGQQYSAYLEGGRTYTIEKLPLSVLFSICIFTWMIIRKPKPATLI